MYVQVAELEQTVESKGESWQTAAEVLPRDLVERLLLDTGGYLQHAALPGVTPAYREHFRGGTGGTADNRPRPRRPRWGRMRRSRSSAH